MVSKLSFIVNDAELFPQFSSFGGDFILSLKINNFFALKNAKIEYSRKKVPELSN